MNMLRIVCIGLLLMGAANALAEPPAKLRVLILSGLNNHDWRTTTPEMEKILRACPRFGTVDITNEPAKLEAGAFANYDVIVSNWTPFPNRERQWPEATEKAFMDFMKNGGGFVVVHAAACTFQVWPEFQQIIALTWKLDFSSHTKYSSFKVSISDKTHPITQGMTDFEITDELYQNLVQEYPQDLHVVCKAYADKAQKGTGKDEPVLVCTQTGKGRGVNLVLGHDVPAMKNPGFRTLLLRSAEWAATGTVTVPVEK